MRLGAHLPLADLGGGLPSATDLTTYARVAHDLGYSTLAANDHLVWKLPWLDGPTALASVLDARGREVRVLASGPHAAGADARAWDGLAEDGRRAAPGVYFVRLIAPSAGVHLVRKGVLLP